MSHVKHVNEQSFRSDVLESPIPVLVDFFAQWCGPCRMLSPILDKLSTEFEGQVSIVKVDVDSSQQLAQTLRVEAMPTLAIFHQGQEVDRVVGAPPEQALREVLTTLAEHSAVKS